MILIHIISADDRLQLLMVQIIKLKWWSYEQWITNYGIFTVASNLLQIKNPDEADQTEVFNTTNDDLIKFTKTKI